MKLTNNNNAAFTLIESLVAIVIMMIVVGIGAPSFARLLEKQRVDSGVSKLYRGLSYARSNAVDREVSITMCPLSGNTCSKDWNLPLYIFTDASPHGILNKQDTVLYELAPAKANNVSLTFPRHRVTFNMDGTAFGSTGSFSVCNGERNQARTVIVAGTGRARKGKDRDGDGIEETASGRPASCI